MTLQPKDRIAALTDGIFAVTMTLLVLDLRVPVGRDGMALFAHLSALASRFDDYIISFVVLCVFWLSHHRLLALLKGVDTAFLWLNLAFVLFTTFVPLVTSVVGTYPHAPLAALIYGLNVALVLSTEYLMWWYGVTRLHSRENGAGGALWKAARLRFGLALAATAAAVAIAMVEIEAGIGVTYSSYVYLVLLVTILFRAHDHRYLPAGDDPPGPEPG